MEQYPREGILIAISIPLYVFFIGLEILLSNLHANHRYSKKGFFQNFYFMCINTFLDFSMRVLALVALMAAFRNAFYQFTNPWMYWISLVLLQDFVFYVMHVVDHKVRLFWAVHVTHHSSEEFNLTVGFRSSVLQPLYRFLYLIPLAFVGFHPIDIFFVFSATQFYGIFIHTQYVKRLGFLEWFMTTPSHHRVHHGKNPQYIDRNMGMLLIIWDKIFGTFTREEEPVVYGVTKPPRNNKPVHTITHEFENMIADVKSAPDLRSKLMYIFGPPGWSHLDETEEQPEMETLAYRHTPQEKMESLLSH
jgi:sterol desaturase/sphingolipid hydroxylase (fatty acid hydroxylase superfamily)